MASRALQKIRVVRPQVIRVRSAPPKKKRGRRRSSGGLMAGAGQGIKSLMWPAVGAFIGAKVSAKPAADIPLAEMTGSKKVAIGILLFGAGHFARIPVLKAMAIGPLAAAAWEFGVTGDVSGDDVEGDDMEGEDDE